MSNDPIVYPYIPNSVPEIKARMLEEIGAGSVEELYAEIPSHLRFKGRLNLPEPILDEASIKRHVERLLQKNRNCSEHLSFLGAGCAQHYVPAVCDEINNRAEFLTAYVGESYADHGKWQAFFEYASLMGDLLEMDVLSCPLYDGPQAAATSLRMASRITGRSQVLLPGSMGEETLSVIRNYLRGGGDSALEVGLIELDPATGLVDIRDLRSKLSDRTAAVAIENPGYLGVIETRAEEISRMVQAHGAEMVVYTDPISLGVMAPPASYGATFACGDFHPLGMHQLCGGGQGGFIATHDDMRYVAEFKDLMFGLTETVREGEYGFGEVLFERTSYGSREKGKEYTGTTTGLWAITAGVYLALLGPRGMQELGQVIMQKAQYAAQRIAGIRGVEILFSTPFFKEFAVSFGGTGQSVKQVNKSLLEHRIIGGRDLSGEFPELGQSALYCVTEIMTKEDIDRLVLALEAVAGQG